MPTYLLITNPISKRGLGEKGIAEVAGLFKAAGAELHVHRTRYAGDAPRVVAEHMRSCDAVIAAGGDGTISEVVDGLAGSGVPLGVIPRGTANVLSKELGIPRDLEGAVSVILKGRTRKIDAGLADGRRFTLMASAGYDARVVEYAHAARGKWFGYTSYALPVARAFVEGDFPEIKVDADGGEYSCRHVVVANVAEYGGPLRPAHGAVHDDGLLDVVMYTRPGRLNLVRYAFAAFQSRTASVADVTRVRAVRVALRSEGDVPLQLDGDPAGRLPRELRALKGDVTVIVP